MTTEICTDGLPRLERAPFVKDTMRAAVSPLEVQHHHEDVRLRMHRTELADVSLLRMTISDTTFRRTAVQARDDAPPTAYIALKMSGTGRVSQDARTARVEPGDLVLTRSNGPATVAMLDGSADCHLHIPFGLLGVPDRVLSRVTAVCMRPDVPLAQVVASHMRALAATPLSPADSVALSRPTVALVKALISVAADEPGPAKDALADTLKDRVVAYLHERWSDHDLTAGSIAQAHHVSTRQLYVLLESAGISLGDWVRARRLEACRDELSRAGARRINVASVGRRWGFQDPTNFGRAFKRAYGMTPGEWRASCTQAGAAGVGAGHREPHRAAPPGAAFVTG